MPFAAFNPLPLVSRITASSSSQGLTVRVQSAKARAAQNHLMAAERLLKRKNAKAARLHLAKAKRFLVAFEPKTAAAKTEKAKLLSSCRALELRLKAPIRPSKKAIAKKRATRRTPMRAAPISGLRAPPIAAIDPAAISAARPASAASQPVAAEQFDTGTEDDFIASDDETLMDSDDETLIMEDDEGGIPMWLIGLGVAGAAFAAYKLLR